MGRKSRKRNRQITDNTVTDGALKIDVDNEEDTARRASTYKKRKTTSDSSDSGMSGLGLDSGLDGMEDSSQESPCEPPDSCHDMPNLTGLDRFSEQHFLKSKSELEPCQGDAETSGIKSEIFDPSFDFHQNFIADNGLDFRNSLDKEQDISVKDEGLCDLSFSNGSDSSLAVTVSKEDHLSNSKNDLDSLGGLTSSVHGTMATVPSLIGGAGTSSTTATAISQPATAMAHIVRVEPGVDGKGYMLHLSIPSLGIGNLLLYTSGLPNLQLQQQLQQQNTESATSLPNPVILSSTGTENQKLAHHVEASTFAPLGSMSPQEGAVAESSTDIGTMQEATDASYITVQPDVQGESDELEGAGLLGLEADTATMNSNGRDLQQLLTEKTHSNNSVSDKIESSAEPEQGVDMIGVAQFVICSDGPMKCELCTFQTDSYSSFKSHIICSHPCWRITKKLSKNRLLVEQSVRASHLPTTVSMRQQSSKKSTSFYAKSEESAAALKMFNSGTPKRQQMMERNKRIFQCGLCLRPFVFEGSALNHIIDTHGYNDPYDFMQVSNDHGQTFTKITRPECSSMEETSGKGLSKAIAISRCQICGYTATSNEQLNEHAKRIHSKQVLLYGLSDCMD